MSSNTLSISTYENQSSFSFTGIDPIETNLGIEQVNDIAQLYYGTEYSGNAVRLSEQVKKKYLTGSQHHGSSISKIFKGLGLFIIEEHFPETIRKKICSIPKDSTIKLDLNDEASIIPWELLHTGSDFLCQHAKIGRIQQKTPHKKEHNENPRMLMVSNPTGDLSGASAEANHIIGRLRGSKISVQRFGSEMRRNMYMDFIGSGRYDIVHYSGHSASSTEPGKSHHVFMDGYLYGNEIEKIQGDFPTLVFSNSCQSAESSLSMKKTGNTSLAGSYLRAGVSGCIAAIWPVSDQAAGEFASDFYTYLMFGDTVGTALLKARRNAFRKWGFWDMIWGSYIYFGDPDTHI